LRRIDEKIGSLTTGQVDLARRVISLEGKVVLLHGDFAAKSERIDRIDTLGPHRTAAGDCAGLIQGEALGKFPRRGPSVPMRKSVVVWIGRIRTFEAMRTLANI
jgi:hypothetical protein